jgi:enoyl-CoA hydratase/carnithine racemase
VLRLTELRCIRAEREDGVLVLTLDRPEHGNSVDDALHSELAQVFTAVRADRSVRVVVLTGAGSAFCVGGDSSPTRTFTTHTGLTPVQEARLIIESLLDLEQPLIAAVNGDAFGLGAILASLADVAFVAASARFGDRHVLGGVTAGNGSAALWPAIVGLNRAKWLVLGGEVLTAQQAVECGLLHRAVPDGTALEAALNLARRWAELDARALQTTKSVLNLHLKAAAAVALHTGLAWEEQILESPEYRARLAARREAASG